MYSPGNPPSDPSQLAQYLVTEHAKIRAAIEQDRDLMNLTPQTVAPKRASEGDLRNAANPWAATLTSGPGIYVYRSGWKFLG